MKAGLNLWFILFFKVFYVKNRKINFIQNRIFLIIFFKKDFSVPFEQELSGDPASPQSDDFIHLDIDQSANLFFWLTTVFFISPASGKPGFQGLQLKVILFGLIVVDDLSFIRAILFIPDYRAYEKNCFLG